MFISKIKFHGKGLVFSEWNGIVIGKNYGNFPSGLQMNNADFETELLYFGHGHAAGTFVHTHSYFQLEYCIEGQLTGLSREKRILLNAGDLWLIPPGVEHGFGKSRTGMDYISVKFASNYQTAPVVSRDPVCRYYLEEIRKIIDGEGPFHAYSFEGKKVIENALSGLLRSLKRNPENKTLSAFEVKLHTRICESGAAANVDGLAEEFGLTRAEFKYLFSKEIGHGRIKNYINAAVLKLAEQHLQYSDYPVNRIAELLHFSSIYAFSRYFRHHRGMTPSEFRKKMSREN